MNRNSMKAKQRKRKMKSLRMKTIAAQRRHGGLVKALKQFRQDFGLLEVRDQAIV